MAYDPGRYYWSAFWMYLFGDKGILSLRLAVAIFQFLGLYVGLMLIAKSKKKQNFLYILLSATILFVWMFPRHKLFDITISILLIGALTYLIKNPSKLRFFLFGLCLGLIGFFGRNHGLYGLIGFFCTILYLRLNQPKDSNFLSQLIYFSCGVGVGYSPLILMLLFTPDFMFHFFEGIQNILLRGTTNLELPVPFPWKVNFLSSSVFNIIYGVLVGFFFIAIIIFGIFFLVASIGGKFFFTKTISPEFASASFLMLPYAHYAYSRSDIGHLAQGIFPFLIGLLIFLSSRPAIIKWSFITFLSISSLLVMHNKHPIYYCYFKERCVDIKILNDNLSVLPSTAKEIQFIQTLTDKYATNNKGFVVTPFWPGAYPLFGISSPIWEIYAIWPRDDSFQAKEIKRIKDHNPSFILINDYPLDGNDQLRYQNTHPLIYKYVLENYKMINHSGNPNYYVFLPN